MAASAQPSAPSLAELPLQHDVAAAWPLYSPSAALSCKRGSGELQSRTLDSATDNFDEATQVAGGGEVDPPPPPPRYRSFLLPGVAAAVPHNNDNDYSHKKNEDLFVLTSTTGGAAADVGGGKSQPQREKDDEEDRGRRDGTAEVVVCLRENKLKAESDLELLHSSRGTPIPTRRKKGTAPSSPATSPPLPLSTLGQSKSAHHHLNIRGSTHINIRSSNSNMTTLDGSSDLKRKQYEQFMAMAQVMKGDSFDTMEEISPPTSPRFLTVSTGSGLMGLKSQQHRYHTHISNSKNLIEGSGAVAGLYSAAAAKSHSRPPLPSSPVSSSAAGGSSSSPSSARFQSFLLLAFITLFIAGTILLTASYSTSPRLFSFSSKGSSRSASGRVTNPEDLDNTWLAERDRLRGRVKSFEIDPLVDQTIRNLNLQPSEDEDDPDAPIDDSYKYRDYTFLLHNVLPRVAQNGTVIMVIANSGYLEFLLNWKSYVDAHNITNYVIIPSDVQMAQQLSYLGVDWAYDPEIGMDALSQSVSYTTDKGSRAWANWNKVVHKKSHYFKKIVEMGYSVMVSDIDMVWLKNPFTAMGDADVDIFFTNDGSAPNKDMSICGGLFYGKNREKSLAFINHVIDCEVTQKKKEQLCMNMWLGSVSGKTNTINISASEAPNYKIMGVDDFPSGAYFFSNKWAGTEFPYVVHNNWIVGKANKLKRFKAFGYWRVDDSSLRNLMINFRFDDHRGKPGRGREGEIADELMVYHTEMRKKFGRFDDRIWLLEKPPVPRMKAADAKPVTKKATVTTTVTSAKAPVRTAAKKTNASAPAKVGPPRKVTLKREPTRNSKYKYIDGNRNPHYSSGR